MSEPEPATFSITVQELISAIIEQAGDSLHKHQWAVVGLKYPDGTQGTPLHPRMRNIRPEVTYVLVKCHCGEPRTYTLDGHWTMAELMKKIGEQGGSSEERPAAATSSDADSCSERQDS